MNDGRAEIYISSLRFHFCAMYICIYLGTFFLFDWQFDLAFHFARVAVDVCMLLR
jgi:hypothetical protein